MRVRKANDRRSGAAAVEAAIVVPVLLLLLYGVISGALYVFAVDEVVTASREGARFASVRGADYEFYTRKPAATADDIRNVVLDQGVLLDRSRITCNVSWSGSNRPGSYVTVEVRYQWQAMGPFGDREIVSRTSMLISY
jgi:Flp pilus assembly protein TadG